MAAAKKAAEAEVQDDAASDDTNTDNAMIALETSLIVERHSMVAMGVGVIPMPLVDILGVTGVQLNMLRKLAEVYDVEFSNKLGRKAVLSLVASSAAVFAALPAASLFQSIPVIGWGLGATSMSILSGASTYAVGQVFIRHFESGGTLLDFDSKKSKSYMKEQFANGKDKVGGFAKRRASKAENDSDANFSEDAAAS